MSTSTPNLNLVKPSGNEPPSRSVINGNMDILDEKIGDVGDTDLQSQVTALSDLAALFRFNSQYVASNEQFNKYLSGISTDCLVVFGFYGSPVNNPFSFASGICIAVRNKSLTSSWMLLGFDGVSKIETKKIS